MIEKEKHDDTFAARPVWPSLKRAMRGRCPACGEGRLLHSYSKVFDRCTGCGEEFHHHQADDFPAYITIFVVGHVLVAALLLVDDIWPDLPLTVHFLIWPALVVVLCLWLLPIFKGMLVAYQWALRMHGFETAHRTEITTEQASTLSELRRRSVA